MASRGRANRDLSQFGIFNTLPDDDDDDNLEDELNNLMGGGKSRAKGRPKKAEVSPDDFNAMVNACLADCPVDIDVDVDGDDADLLDELNDMVSDEEEESRPSPKVVPARPAPVPEDVYGNNNLLAVVESRIAMYTSAKEAAASAGDSSHARRYGRALDQLKDSRRRLKVGKAVNEDDIPPPLSEKQIKSLMVKERPPASDAHPSLPPRQEPSKTPLPSGEDKELLELKIRRESYKKEALAAKERGDKEAAIQGLRGVKAMDELIKNYGSPNVNNAVSSPSQPTQPTEIDKDKPLIIPSNVDELPPQNTSVFGAPPPPTTVIEALTQRLQYYEKEEIKAKEAENASKARRIGRICKQYKDAIKAHKSGKPFDADSLPAPLGYGPIPSAKPSPAKAPAAKGPAALPKPAASSPSSHNISGAHSIQGKQLKTLLERQALFKAAALDAKKAGQMSQAKEYLRQYHGFDNLIEASKGGLPVDLSSTPVPPQLVQKAESAAAMDFEIISRQPSCDEGKSRQEMFEKLEKELLDQVKMCQSNKAYFKSTADIPTSNKFQQMEVHTKKDLTALRHAFKRNDPVPSFHYEVRSFSKVVCNTDLTDNEVELSILEGNNFKGDKSIDTYICYEFPYPKEDPFKGETSKVKDSTSPKFDHQVSIPINIKEKSCQRIFKRHSVKCDVWIDRGFFRKDILLGTAQVKLQHLENHCTLHECFPLMDGRKAVGGTLEVKVRLRNPVLSKQVEKAQEKWLVISF